MSFRFRDRREAGRMLSQKLLHFSDEPKVSVLALPRGGVPIGFEVSLRLNVPLRIFLVRKLGAPTNNEFAIGAIASGGIRFVNDEVVRTLKISLQQVEQIVEREERELERRSQLYGDEFTADGFTGQTFILVDDGLATGSTMRAAVTALKRECPARIVIAIPVASVSAFNELSQEVDEIVCLQTPERFQAVGEWYETFSQTTDEEVQKFLEKARFPETNPLVFKL